MYKSKFLMQLFEDVYKYMRNNAKQYCQFVKEIIIILEAILGTYSFGYFLSIDLLPSFFNMLLVLFIYVLRKRFMQQIINIDKIYSIISSALLIFGKEVYDYHSFINVIYNPLYYALLFYGTYILLTSFITITYYFGSKLVRGIEERFADRELYNLLTGKKIFYIFLLILTIEYIIPFVIFYPGIFDGDIVYQMKILNGTYDWDNHHPVLHTLYLALALKIQYLVGIDDFYMVVMSVTQITVSILASVYIIKWIIKREYSITSLIFAYIYMIINPTIQTHVLVTTKEPIFSVFLCLLLCWYFTLLLYDGTKAQYFNTIVIALLAMLFRNNMVYSLILMLIIQLFIKKLRPIAVKILLPAIVLYFIVLRVIYPICGIRPVQVHEMMSIPAVCVTAVNNETDVYSDSERQVVRDYVIDLESYNYRIADSLKNAMDIAKFKSDPLPFVKVMIKGFFKAPVRFISAALDLNIQYWYPNASIIDPYSQVAYICNADRLDYSSANAIESFYYHIVDATSFIYKIPGISFLFSLSFCFWFMLGCTYVCVRQNKKESMVIVLFCLSFWATYLFGPVANYRYVSPIYFVIPVLMAVVIANKKETFVK